jgi:hypothetical protein
MKLNVREEWVENIQALVSPKENQRLGYEWCRLFRGDIWKLDIGEFSDTALAKLLSFLEAHAEAGDGSAKRCCKNVRQWMAIKQNPDGTHEVDSLQNLEPVLKQVIGQNENRYICERTPDGNLLPWFVCQIEYIAASGRGPQRQKPCVQLKLRATNSEGESVKTLDAKDIHKHSLLKALAAKGLHLQTLSVRTRYQAELRKYRQYNERIGLQMSVRGVANLVEGWRGVGFRSVEMAGRPARMVVDIAPPPKPNRFGVYSELDEDSDEGCIHAPYWSTDEETLWELPVHPVLNMFDLEEHASYRVHVKQVEPYVYNTAMDQNLVLPAAAKNFIRSLIGHSKESFQDIIKGKEGGTIVLLEGPPGVGKTLTAEIYAEVMERPLYRVHSSLIGINPEKIEAALKEVLARAERWAAILLIDEGDVFLHERGNDIVQNAVVGVFLRLLEYYRGVLFTTTNRGTMIDDAIVSRLTARFEYGMPTVDEQKALWRILGAQNGIDFTGGQIDEIVHRLPDLSGRDIKNLLKLALVALRATESITPDLLVQVSCFRQARKIA